VDLRRAKLSECQILIIAGPLFADLYFSLTVGLLPRVLSADLAGLVQYFRPPFYRQKRERLLTSKHR
jgi:hypothetical protein